MTSTFIVSCLSCFLLFLSCHSVLSWFVLVFIVICLPFWKGIDPSFTRMFYKDRRWDMYVFETPINQITVNIYLISIGCPITVFNNVLSLFYHVLSYLLFDLVLCCLFILPCSVLSFYFTLFCPASFFHPVLIWQSY